MERTSFQTINATSVHRSAAQAKLLQLKPGQIFEGKVLKLYPNQTASLRLGTMHVIARLQAAISVGEKYFFQVTKNEGVPHLKVLETPRNTVPIPAQTTNDVLKAMDLPFNKANEMMLQLFQKEQIPFSKEMIQQGGALLKRFQLMNEEGVRVFTHMYHRNIPFTERTFQAVRAALTGPPLVEQLKQFEQQLMNESAKALPMKQSEALKSVQHMLTTIIQSSTIPKENGQPSSPQLEAFHRLIQRSLENPLYLLRTLQQANIVKGDIHLSGFLTTLQQTVLSQEHTTIMDLFSIKEGNVRLLHEQQPETFFRTLFTSLSTMEGRKGLESFQRLFAWLGSARGIWTSQSASSLQQWIATLPTHVEGLSSDENANAFLRLLKNFPQLSGFFHEKNIFEHHMQQRTLKMSLLEKLPYLPSKVREQAETVLHRVTGAQLLAEEQHGWLHQTTIQVPLFLGGHQTDVTIQWEGRKTKTNHIDPAHCRILFYLEMAHFGEMVTDVHIQQRVVTVTIFNEKEEPKAIIAMWQPYLQKQLEKLHYQFNALYWKNPTTMKRADQRDAAHVGYEGVDIRI
ncbi:hypothetical protein ACFPTR_04050 [Aliibacillus thermotolerans]|uniref:Flagellar hook-length control protein FliK n=1 Tax=Aliibacillus thermotolerans TaxID=1834418 RepID=A0ABW0U3M9_9BACI|nr:hypothetical protein [Aliibacillus thermotolerans]MDA3130631.1 hypothetical protein [Aliibacillus thermotolerans]